MIPGSAILAFETGATDETDETGKVEVVSKTVARTPLATQAGGQDDNSYTNSLKLEYNMIRVHASVGKHVSYIYISKYIYTYVYLYIYMVYSCLY